MTKKLLAIAATTLLAIGCTPQSDDSADITAVAKESPAAWPTTLDEVRDPTPDDASNSNAQDPHFERLKFVSQAFHAYQEHFGHFPPAVSTDVSGRQLLSWRVHILPFIDEYDLYKRFRLDEPWDSDHNQRLVAEMPALYQSPGVELDGHTSLMVFTGENTVFGVPQSRSTVIPLLPYTRPPDSIENPMEEESLPTQEFDGGLNQLDGGQPATASPTRQLSAGPTYHDLTDGTANTLLAVYAGADKSVPWSKPDDLPFHPEDPAAALGAIPDAGTLAVFWDTQVRNLPKDIDRLQLKSLIDSTEFTRKERDTSINNDH